MDGHSSGARCEDGQHFVGVVLGIFYGDWLLRQLSIQKGPETQASVQGLSIVWPTVSF
jgi:hypothetical protein